MSKLDKDTVLAAFTEAYEQKHGKTPEIDAGGGWYSIDGGKKVRLADIDAMVSEMQGGSNAPDEAPAKKQAKPKKKAQKKPEQFSVKDFYAQQILAKYPGSKEPR